MLQNAEVSSASEPAQAAACMAGLAFANAFVGVNHALAHSLGARFHLPERCGMPTSTAAAGVPRAEFEAALPALIAAAYDDISLRSNPRMPLLHELEGILRQAYDGTLQ